jgi:hypothetical protein
MAGYVVPNTSESLKLLGVKYNISGNVFSLSFNTYKDFSPLNTTADTVFELCLMFRQTIGNTEAGFQISTVYRSNFNRIGIRSIGMICSAKTGHGRNHQACIFRFMYSWYIVLSVLISSASGFRLA